MEGEEETEMSWANKLQAESFGDLDDSHIKAMKHFSENMPFCC